MSTSFIFLGTGTSQGIPVIGCQCLACISKDPRDNRTRTSSLIQTTEGNILIDIGPDFRQQMLREKIPSIDAILLTHEHNDHIIGLDDIRPIFFKNRDVIPIYGMPRVLHEVRSRFPYFFVNNTYPGVPKVRLIPVLPGESVQILNQTIQTFPVNHGPLIVLGFQIENLTYITDAKRLSKEVINQIQGTEILAINALQEKSHPTHLTLSEALEMVTMIQPTRSYFIHMSHTLGPISEIEQILPENVFFAQDGLVLRL